MYTLNHKKIALRYMGIIIFCGIFTMIYYQFSHNVYSVYLTYLFAIPLVLGVLPSVLLLGEKETGKWGIVAINAYHSGVATLAVSSMLRGIFEIAGTGSPWQEYLFYAAIVMLVMGVILKGLKR